MKKAKLYAIALIMILLLSFPMSVNAAKVKLNKKSITLPIGASFQLKVKGTKKKVKWKSSNKRVVTVNKKGLVKAKKTGKVTIKAKVGKKTYKCKVTVRYDGIYHTEKGDIQYYDYRPRNSLFSLKIDIIGNELIIEGQLMRGANNKSERVKGDKHVFIISSQTTFWSGDTVISKSRFLSEAKNYKKWLDIDTRGLLLNMRDGKVVNVGWW